jgi:DNA-binding NtrC family response regulator
LIAVNSDWPQPWTARTACPWARDDFIGRHERRYIEETIKHNGGSRDKAAKMLGISMATLYRKLEVKSPRAASAKA